MKKQKSYTIYYWIIGIILTLIIIGIILYFILKKKKKTKYTCDKTSYSCKWAESGEFSSEDACNEKCTKPALDGYQCIDGKCASCTVLYKCQDGNCIQCSTGCEKGSCDANPCHEYYNDDKCTIFTDCSKSCGQTTTKYVGINLAGFDLGESLDTKGYVCIPNDMIQWIKDNNMNIVRLPIAPLRILKSIPTDTTQYSDDLFTDIWANNDDDNKTCPTDKSYDNSGTYIGAIQQCLKNGLDVIIDPHNDTFHLCSLQEKTVLTTTQFNKMWEFIATYINKHISQKEKIWFELYNEPIIDGCAEEHEYLEDSNDWVDKYVIPTVETILNINPNAKILVTTFDNYSGVHFWGSDDEPDKKNLGYLVQQLDAKKFSKDNVYIAGHQYCDSDYSGGGSGCDSQKFSKTVFQKWIEEVNRILDNKYYWFMTEGNVKCGKDTCKKGDLYIDWLKYIINDPNCIGFTVWESCRQNYFSPNMGAGVDVKYDFKGFTTDGVYQTSSDGNHYSFASQFLS